MQDTIKEIFTESIQVQIAAGEVLPSALESAAFTIAQSLINGNLDKECLLISENLQKN